MMNKSYKEILIIALMFPIELIKRGGLYQANFTSGTTTFHDCLTLLTSLLRFESIREGRYIEKFHRTISELLGIDYVYTFSAGRMALYAILEAAGVKEDDEIILPGYTCVVVSNAIIAFGAVPIYVDITRRTYSIDPSKVEEKITPKTKVIIAQHTYGIPCDIEELRRMCDSHGLLLIEDCAHLFGTEYNGQKLGTFGDAAFFSLDHTKFISTSVGGVAVSNNEKLRERIKAVYDKTPFLGRFDILRILFQLIWIHITFAPTVGFIGRYFYGFVKRLGLTFFMDDYHTTDMPTKYPFPAKLSNIQAKIGLKQLENLKKNNDHRLSLVSAYSALITESDPPRYPLLRYVLEVKNRDEWVEALSPVLRVESWFNSVTQNRTENLEEVGYTSGSCPIAEEVTVRIIDFPTHQRITPSRFKKIANKITGELKKGISYTLDIQIKDTV